MSSVFYKTADAFKDILNSQSFNDIQLSAVVDLVPDYSSEKIKNLTVVVTPDTVTSDIVTFDGNERVRTVSIGLMDRIKQNELDNHIAIVEEIMDKLESEDRLPDDLGSIILVEADPLYDIDRMRSKKIFVSILKVTVKC